MPIYVPGKVVFKKDPVLAEPYYNNVSLLLHCNGANGSTTFTDSSPSPKTMTAFGDAQVTTTAPKFGSGAMLLDGTGDVVRASASADLNFGTGDFTIEFFVKFNASTRQYISDYNENESAIIIAPSSGKVEVYSNASHAINTGSTPFNTAQWYHIALARSGGTWRVFRDGTLYLQATGQASRTFGSSTNPFQISGAIPFNGAFDEWRITKGVARYTANFTPPTAPFPDF
jgi:hypothetical protein